MDKEIEEKLMELSNRILYLEIDAEYLPDAHRCPKCGFATLHRRKDPNIKAGLKHLFPTDFGTIFYCLTCGTTNRKLVLREDLYEIVEAVEAAERGCKE